MHFVTVQAVSVLRQLCQGFCTLAQCWPAELLQSRFHALTFMYVVTIINRESALNISYVYVTVEHNKYYVLPFVTKCCLLLLIVALCKQQ